MDGAFVEAICNVVSNHFTEDDLRKLDAPITHYANVFLEHISRNIGHSDSLGTIQVTYPTDGSHEDTVAGTGSVTKISSPESSSARPAGKRKLSPGQGDSNEGDSDDGDSRFSRRDARHGASKKLRTESVGRLSCPFRKRNPTRSNIRDHSPCALRDFPSIPHLK